jgi:hypothetical protein
MEDGLATCDADTIPGGSEYFLERDLEVNAIVY